MGKVDEERRQSMVEQQLIPRGISDPAVLEAMRSVPRHLFVDEANKDHAYNDSPLPIEEGQTISQPFIVALMTQLAQLSPESKVLEIGTGSGYAAAVLSQCVKQVYSIERMPLLADLAKDRLKKLGYHNVEVHEGDGTRGLPEHAPFDSIIVTAGAPKVPPSLIKQLNFGGTLLLPVGDSGAQELVRVTKDLSGEVREEFLEAVRFVPLIGEEGWDPGK